MEKGTLISDDFSGRLARKEMAENLIHQQQKKKRQWQHNCIATGNVPSPKRDEVPLLMRQQLILKSPDDKSGDENLCYVNKGFNFTTVTSPDVIACDQTAPAFSPHHQDQLLIKENEDRKNRSPAHPSVASRRQSSLAFHGQEDGDSVNIKLKTDNEIKVVDAGDAVDSDAVDGNSSLPNQPNGNITNNNTKLDEAEKDMWSSVTIDNVHEFVMTIPPVGVTVQCRLERDKFGIDKNIFPIYSLYIDQANHEKTLILAARKRMKSTTSYYVISTNANDISKKDGENFIGKLRSNLIGTQFVLYDSGLAPTHAGYDTNLIRKELVSVVYESNILGFNGPRNMSVIIPTVTSLNTRYDHRPVDENDSLYAMWKKDRHSHIIGLRNKSPIWNGDTQSFVLNFNGRVTLPSVKNFQIVPENDVNNIVLQFGRIGEDRFTLDYTYPMCAFQAFGIALSSIDKKMACE